MALDGAQGMFVEVLPARVQVALQVMHAYRTEQWAPVRYDVEAQKAVGLGKQETAARDQALRTLVQFMAGEHDFVHGARAKISHFPPQGAGGPGLEGLGAKG